MMRRLGIIFLGVAALGAAPPTDSTWRRTDRRALEEVFALAERNAVAFTSHQKLFTGALRAFRDRFATGLKLTPREGAIAVACGASSLESPLPTGSKEAAAALIVLSPLLEQCTEAGRREGGTHAQLVTYSVLDELDAGSTLAILEPHARRPAEEEPRTTHLILGAYGYVSIPFFLPGAADRVGDALEQFEAVGVRGIVVDLRGNVGGEVTEIARVLEQFAPEGALLFSTRGRTDRDSRDFVAEGPGLDPDVGVAVLVNGTMPSGAELFALSMRQLRHASLVGERMGGVNRIRTVYRLRNGWYIALTTGSWVVPNDSRSSNARQDPTYLAVSGAGPQPLESDPVVAAALEALAR